MRRQRRSRSSRGTARRGPGLRATALLAVLAAATAVDWIVGRQVMATDGRAAQHSALGSSPPDTDPATGAASAPELRDATIVTGARSRKSLLHVQPTLSAGTTGVTPPPATPTGASSELELWPARLDPRPGVAGGIPTSTRGDEAPRRVTGIQPTRSRPGQGPAVETGPAQGLSPSPTLPTSRRAAAQGDPSTRAPGRLTRAAAVVAAGGWALAQFFGSGAWTGEARTVFDSDARSANTDGDPFEVGRRSTQAGVTIRNSQLVLGPRLLVGHLGLDLAAMRDDYRVNARSSPGSGRVVGYDFGTTAVPDRRYSAGVFLSRTQTTLPVLFGTSRDLLTSVRGIRTRLKGPWLDSTIEWRWSKLQARARTDARTLRDGEERTVLSYAGTRQGDRQSLALEHREEHRRDLVYPDFTYPLRFSNLRHVLVLDREGGRRNLSTSLAASQRGGIQPTDYFRGEVRLDYRLTSALESRAVYRRDRIDARTFGRDQHAVDLQLQHRLYESVVTTVSGRLSQDALRTGDRQLRGVTFQLDYRKRLVAGGRLLASVGQRLDREDNRFSERESAVLGEVHEARIGLPFRLQRDRVVPGSIVVTDAGGTVVYREPVDFTVDYFGDFAEIRIQPDGRILDGRTILVDYRIRVSPQTTIDNRQPSYALAVDYGWINPYIQSTTVERQLVSGFDDGTVFGRRTRTEGVNLRWNPPRTRIMLRSERLTEESRNLSYTALQFGQVASVALGGGRTLSASADEARLDFDTPVRQETRVAGQVDFRWPVTRALTLTATSSARTRRDTAGIDESLNQGLAEVQWERRRLFAALVVGRDWGVRDGRRFGGVRIGARVTRTF